MLGSSWVLQDGGGDNVSLVGWAGTSGTGVWQMRVVAQWVYDAYGSVLSADHLWPHALLRCGHKGLFFDRLDVGVADWAGASGTGAMPGTSAAASEPPRLVPFAQGFYHVRNRVYAPGLGRWLQRDPNASGLAVMEALAFHGGTQMAAAMSVDLEQVYGDGMSLYAYLGIQPLGAERSYGTVHWLGAQRRQRPFAEPRRHGSRGIPSPHPGLYSESDLGC